MFAFCIRETVRVSKRSLLLSISEKPNRLDSDMFLDMQMFYEAYVCTESFVPSLATKRAGRTGGAGMPIDIYN